MFNYIVLTCLLSFAGGAIYFLGLRRLLSAQYAKYFVLTVICLSFCIPLLIPHIPNYSSALQQEYTFDHYTYNEWNVVDISDPELLECYETADNSNQVCECEVIQQSKTFLAYTPDPVYNVMNTCKIPVLILFIGLGIFFLFQLGFKIYGLYRITNLGTKTQGNVRGKTYYLIHLSDNSLPISAFSLWNNYIIWPDYLNGLSQEEQDAIFWHEWAHLQQKDTWQQFLLHLTQIFWWFNPMFWIFRKELSRLNEFVADEITINRTKNVRSYANLLLRIKEYQLETCQPSYAFAFAQSLLKTRILRMIDPKPSKPFHKSFFLLLFLTLFLLNFYIQPILEKQTVAYTQYQILKKANNQTGQSYFCKDCLVKTLKNKK